MGTVFFLRMAGFTNKTSIYFLCFLKQNARIHLFIHHLFIAYYEAGTLVGHRDQVSPVKH